MESADEHVGIAPCIHLGGLLAVRCLAEDDIAEGTDVGYAEAPVGDTHIEDVVFLATRLLLLHYAVETTVGPLGDEDGVVGGGEELVVGIHDVELRHGAVGLVDEQAKCIDIVCGYGGGTDKLVERLTFLAYAEEACIGLYLLFLKCAVLCPYGLLVLEIASVAEDTGEVAASAEVRRVALYVDIQENDMGDEGNEGCLCALRSRHHLSAHR